MRCRLAVGTGCKNEFKSDHFASDTGSAVLAVPRHCKSHLRSFANGGRECILAERSSGNRQQARGKKLLVSNFQTPELPVYRTVGASPAAQPSGYNGAESSPVFSIRALLLTHGYVFLFSYILAVQSGVPVPSDPLLLIMGALAGDRLYSFPASLCLALIAALIGDTLWYEVGASPRQVGSAPALQAFARTRYLRAHYGVHF